MGCPTLMATQLLKLPHGPTGQSAIQLAQNWVKRRLVVAAIVVNPAMEDWIEHPGQVVESLIAPQVESPTPHSAAHRLGGFITHCGTEVDEVLTPTILRPPGTKRESQKIKLLGGVMASSIIILAIDQLGLSRMKLQLALSQPSGNRLPQCPSFRFCLAVDHHIIGISHKRILWISPPHPFIKSIVQEQVGEQRADHPALRRALLPGH